MVNQAMTYSLGGASNDALYGGVGMDVLWGLDGDDVLDGGVGNDGLYGGEGADTFVLRAGDGGASVELADIISDFEDGTDLIGMGDSIVYSELTIEQGSGSYSNDTLVSITSTGEYLAVVEGVSFSAFDEQDFTPFVDIL